MRLRRYGGEGVSGCTLDFFLAVRGNLVGCGKALRVVFEALDLFEGGGDLCLFFAHGRSKHLERVKRSDVSLYKRGSPGIRG